MGVNSLPKTVTRQYRDCDLNLGPSAPESSTLTTRQNIYSSENGQHLVFQNITMSIIIAIPLSCVSHGIGIVNRIVSLPSAVSYEDKEMMRFSEQKPQQKITPRSQQGNS